MNHEKFDELKKLFNINKNKDLEFSLKRLGFYEYFFYETGSLELAAKLNNSDNLNIIKDHFQLDKSYGILEVFTNIELLDDITSIMKENKSHGLIFEYEVVDKIASRNLIYSLILGVVVPFLSLTIYKDIPFFLDLSTSIDGRWHLTIYLLMVIYVIINSARYLDGILHIHSQIKYVGAKFIKKIDFSESHRVLNLGIFEILVLFLFVLLIITDFNGNFLINPSDNTLSPHFDETSKLTNNISRYCYIIFFCVLILTLTDWRWLKIIEKSPFHRNAKESIDNGVPHQPYLKKFIDTVSRQTFTSKFDLIIITILIGLVLIKDFPSKFNLNNSISYKWIIIPIIMLIISAMIDLLKLDFSEKLKLAYNWFIKIVTSSYNKMIGFARNSFNNYCNWFKKTKFAIWLYNKVCKGFDKAISNGNNRRLDIKQRICNKICGK